MQMLGFRVSSPRYVLLFVLIQQLATDVAFERASGKAEALVQACSCRYCGDVTYCHEMGHNIVPVGLPGRGVKRLLLNGNSIKTLYSGEFRDMNQLTVLVLNNNSIATVDSRAFNGLTNLQSLHLEHNQIEFLPRGSLAQLKNLKNLFLDHNKLTRLPGDIPYLRRLEKLTLAYNRLSAIYWASFIQLDSLKLLTLWENPLICDCNTMELARWFALTPSGKAVTGSNATDRCQNQTHQVGRCTRPKVTAVQHERDGRMSYNYDYTVSGEARLHCNTSGIPAPLVYWQSKTAGYVFPFREGRIAAYPNGTLVISHLRKSDSGTYACYARLSSASGDDPMRKTIVVVRDGVPPKATAVDKEIQVPSKGVAKLYCRVSGIPLPGVVWRHVSSNQLFHEGNVTDPRITSRFYQDRNNTDPRKRILHGSSEMEIRDLSTKDAGEWRCEASSSQGTSYDVTTLVVNVGLLGDVTVIIIGSLAGVIFLVVVAVVTAIACVLRKRRKEDLLKTRRSRGAGGGGSSDIPTDAEIVGGPQIGEWRKREEKKVEAGEERGGGAISEELEQPFEGEPQVKGFRL